MKTEVWQEKAAFIAKLRELTERLNRCRAAYEAHTPLVSDEVYDEAEKGPGTLYSSL